MNKKLMDAFRNPIQNKLLLTINSNGQATAKQLLEANKTIPQATLYRHLAKLEKDGILKVVQENRIRGIVEKVYALGVDLSKSASAEYLTGESYMNLFTEYMVGIMQEFSAYTSQENIDIVHDGSGFSIMPIYVTNEEFMEVAQKIAEILMPLTQNTPTPERRHHNVGLILTPPQIIE